MFEKLWDKPKRAKNILAMYKCSECTVKMNNYSTRWYIRLWGWVKKEWWLVAGYVICIGMIHLLGILTGHTLGMACALFVELKIMGVFL